MTRNAQIGMSGRDPTVAQYLLNFLRKQVHAPQSPTYIIDLQQKCIRNGISKRRVRTVVRNGFRGRLLKAILKGMEDDMLDIIRDALRCGVEDQFLTRSLHAMREQELKHVQQEARKKLMLTLPAPSTDRYVQ